MMQSKFLDSTWVGGEWWVTEQNEDEPFPNDKQMIETGNIG